MPRCGAPPPKPTPSVSACRRDTLGAGTGQNQTFIAGIYGTPLSGTAHAVYIDANGQLGTVAVGGAGGFLPMSQIQQQVDNQSQAQLRDQETANAELRARLAKLEAHLASAARRK